MIVSNVRDFNVVKPQLTNVQQIEASGGAFAAILDDGSVFTWGEAEYGGDCSAVQGCRVSGRSGVLTATSCGSVVNPWLLI